MSSVRSTIQQDFCRSEANYTAYTLAFLHFLFRYLQELTNDNLSTQEKKQIEKQLVCSLHVIGELHHHLLKRKNLLDSQLNLLPNTPDPDPSDNEALQQQLLRFKKLLTVHRFQLAPDKQQCLTIVNHLLNHYQVIPIINQSPSYVPWVDQNVSGSLWKKESGKHDTASID
ncbi:hypothetical protein [Gracilibacillus timonensis]|uniref:hypothetical protein n=1 Tax=Gracilibacillus timonensis TaxID=1816696 RepID=UPI000825F74D|nr:hypothetical protein [Gracilibacillus timonensis]